jgi:hypothetical protein
MKSKIIEIQNKIDAVNGEIEELETLSASCETGENLATVLESLNDQRNEFLISEKMGNNHKEQIAETDKSIKAAKLAIEKQKEQQNLANSIKRKIEGKNNTLLELTERHKRAVNDLLKELVKDKSNEREKAFNAFLDLVFQIEAAQHLSRHINQNFTANLSHDTFQNSSLLTALNMGDIISNAVIQPRRDDAVLELKDALLSDGITAVI